MYNTNSLAFQDKSLIVACDTIVCLCENQKPVLHHSVLTVALLHDRHHF